jgi:hypothetical protein
MRFSPRETASRSIGLLEAEFGALDRFSPDAVPSANSGLIQRELDDAHPPTMSGGIAGIADIVARGTPVKRKVERANEPALASDARIRGR